jgi:hypothetical protein
VWYVRCHFRVSFKRVQGIDEIGWRYLRVPEIKYFRIRTVLSVDLPMLLGYPSGRMHMELNSRPFAFATDHGQTGDTAAAIRLKYATGRQIN